MIGRMVNALIVGLNTRERLPCLILLVIDKDLVDDVNMFNFKAEDIIADNLAWFFCQFEMLIKRKRMELSDKKPRAVYSSDLKIIVVDMLKRPLEFPQRSTMQGAMSMCTSFNSILNDAAEHYGYNRIFIESCSSEYQYDKMGKLNDRGKIDFWSEVNSLIEKFDCRKIRLLLQVQEKHKYEYLKRKSKDRKENRRPDY